MFHKLYQPLLFDLSYQQLRHQEPQKINSTETDYILQPCFVRTEFVDVEEDLGTINNSMLVHVRSCLYKRMSKNKRKQRLFIQLDNSTSPNYQHHLRCDAETFDISVPVIPLSEGLHLPKITEDLRTTSSCDHVISSSDEFNHLIVHRRTQQF